MDDYDIDHEYSCPKCGHTPIHSRDCTNFCDDGYFDESDDEYMLPGNLMEKCPECRGTGVEIWCPKCGANLSGVKLECDDD